MSAWITLSISIASKNEKYSMFKITDFGFDIKLIDIPYLNITPEY